MTQGAADALPWAGLLPPFRRAVVSNTRCVQSAELWVTIRGQLLLDKAQPSLLETSLPLNQAPLFKGECVEDGEKLI